VPFLPGFEHMVRNLATVPVISLGPGSIAGFGAAKVVSSHYPLLVRGQSQVFVAGPPVIAAAGQKLTKAELGTSRIHASNGAPNFSCPPSRATDARSIACVRSSRPSSTWARSSRSTVCMDAP